MQCGDFVGDGMAALDNQIIVLRRHLNHVPVALHCHAVKWTTVMQQVSNLLAACNGTSEAHGRACAAQTYMSSCSTSFSQGSGSQDPRALGQLML